MRIITFQNKEIASDYVSKEILNQIKSNNNSVIGLAGGATMKGIYKKLSNEIINRKIDINGIKTFNLDEYYASDYKYSLRKEMDDSLFNKINIKNEQINFLSYREKKWKKECKRYQKLIENNKIGLQLLGLGKNAHIAYNEPGSSINSITRRIKITQETLKDKKLKTPYALTVGIKEILKAKKIILVAFGKEKAKAVASLFNGKISNKYPASFLQKHKNVEIVLDNEAAAFLKRIK